MTLFQLLLGHTLAAGVAGIFAQWHIAASLLSTESIDSPHPVTRWWYRYLLFSFWYLVSFLLTPALAAPLLKSPAISSMISENEHSFFLLLLPLATLLYFADRWVKIRFDGTKVSAREKLRAKLLAPKRR